MSESKSAKPRYKTTNWAAYNAALKARGSLQSTELKPRYPL